MSNTSMTREFELAISEFGLTERDLERITLNSIKSAFIPSDAHIRLIYDVTKPGYAAARDGSLS